VIAVLLTIASWAYGATLLLTACACLACAHAGIEALLSEDDR